MEAFSREHVLGGEAVPIGVHRAQADEEHLAEEGEHRLGARPPQRSASRIEHVPPARRDGKRAHEETRVLPGLGAPADARRARDRSHVHEMGPAARRTGVTPRREPRELLAHSGLVDPVAERKERVVGPARALEGAPEPEPSSLVAARDLAFEGEDLVVTHALSLDQLGQWCGVLAARRLSGIRT